MLPQKLTLPTIQIVSVNDQRKNSKKQYSKEKVLNVILKQFMIFAFDILLDTVQWFAEKRHKPMLTSFHYSHINRTIPTKIKQTALS